MSILKPALFFVSVVLLSSCNTNDIETPGRVQPRDIFFDYKIWGEEGKNEVTCLLQFRYRRESGRTVKLDSPSHVEVDGELISADSARLTGSFYEIQKPIHEFIGKHTITVKDVNDNEYIEEFTFQPFTLPQELPDTIYRNDLIFNIQGLKPIDYLRVIAIDTSFISDDINEIDTLKMGKLIISKEKLEKLVNGPVTLLLNKEEESPVKNGTARGGKISVTYSLKRQLILMDQPGE